MLTFHDRFLIRYGRKTVNNIIYIIMELFVYGDEVPSDILNIGICEATQVCAMISVIQGAERTN